MNSFFLTRGQEPGTEDVGLVGSEQRMELLGGRGDRQGWEDRQGQDGGQERRRERGRAKTGEGWAKTGEGTGKDGRGDGQGQERERGQTQMKALLWDTG